MILLLDGMNEIGNKKARDHFRQFFIREIVDHGYLSDPHSDRSEGNFVILTSRINGYEEAPFSGKHLKEFIINGLNDASISHFLSKWYKIWQPDYVKRGAKYESILNSLKHDPNLCSLAQTPLLLTMLVLMDHANGGLPVNSTC